MKISGSSIREIQENIDYDCLFTGVCKRRMKIVNGFTNISLGRLRKIKTSRVKEELMQDTRWRQVVGETKNPFTG